MTRQFLIQSRTGRSIGLRRGLSLLLPMVFVLSLGACREEEQGRSLHYEKGTYQGAPDEALDPGTVSNLQQRLYNQRAP